MGWYKMTQTGYFTDVYVHHVASASYSSHEPANYWPIDPEMVNECPGQCQNIKAYHIDWFSAQKMVWLEVSKK